MIRELDWNAAIEREVRVYRNLNNGKMSLQTKQQGRWIVAGHITDCVLKAVHFHVSESGRQRVIRQSTKNVHAYAQGILIAQFDDTVSTPINLSYDPYRNATFVERSSQQPLSNCNYLAARENHVWVSRDALTNKTSVQPLQNILQLPLLWQSALWQVA